MTGLRGMFAGVLALVALETLVSTSGAADRTGGLFSTLGGLVTRLLDPTVAAIPDLAGGSSSSSGGGGLHDPLPNLIPDIPGVPQGPITRLPFSPISYPQRTKPPAATVQA